MRPDLCRVCHGEKFGRNLLSDIKRRVERRLNLWIDGNYDALVQDIVGGSRHN